MGEEGPPARMLCLSLFCRRLIALEMAKIHTIHANGSLPKPTLWHKMHSYFTLVKNEVNPRYEGRGGGQAASVSPPTPGGFGVSVLIAGPLSPSGGG